MTPWDMSATERIGGLEMKAAALIADPSGVVVWLPLGPRWAVSALVWDFSWRSGLMRERGEGLVGAVREEALGFPSLTSGSPLPMVPSWRRRWTSS